MAPPSQATGTQEWHLPNFSYGLEQPFALRFPYLGEKEIDHRFKRLINSAQVQSGHIIPPAPGMSSRLLNTHQHADMLKR